MEFTRAEITAAWERAAMRTYETTNPFSPDDQKLVDAVRGLLDAVERGVKRAWDAFDDEDWDECAREALDIHDRVAQARSKLLDLHHAQSNRSGVSPPEPHRDEPPA